MFQLINRKSGANQAVPWSRVSFISLPLKWVELKLKMCIVSTQLFSLGAFCGYLFKYIWYLSFL